MKKHIKLIIVIVLVCMVVISIALIIKSKLFNKDTKKHNWIIKKVVTNRDDFYRVEPQLATVPKWNELTITQQFFSFKYNERNYTIRYATLAEEMIDKKIGNVVLKGYDSYTKTTYTHNASGYIVKSFPTECIIAIKYEGTNEYYVAINTSYRPTTLENFMNDLNLKEIVSFGTVYYDYFSTDKDGNKHYESIEFPDVNNDIIWEMLFDDLSVENVHDDKTYHSPIMGISVDIPLLGYKNISVSVSEDGYLTTNILGTGKTFYIGKEKVESFVNYIIENYNGYKTVYVDENGNELSMDNIEENEEATGNDTIVVYDIKTNETTQYIPNSSNKNFTEPYNPQK